MCIRTWQFCDMDYTEEDHQQIEEELEALASIYGQDLHFQSERGLNGGNFRVNLFPDWEARIEFGLPVGYPTSQSPQITLLVPYLRGEPRQRIEEQLRATAERSTGQCCIFQLVEEARELLTQAFPMPVSDIPSSEIAETTADDKDLRSSLPVPEIVHGEPFTERKSTFQSHAAEVHSIDEVNAVISRLKTNRKIADATHNVMAYRISGPGQCIISDCDDDGELQAGSRLLHLLNILDVKNKVIVVSRWFGGVLLGPERFKHITNAARDLLTKSTAKDLSSV